MSEREMDFWTVVLAVVGLVGLVVVEVVARGW